MAFGICLLLRLLMTVLCILYVLDFCTSSKRRNNYPEDYFSDDAYYLLLVGKSGHGKSALGNHLLSENAFESRLSPKSVTKKCKIVEGNIGDQPIVVVDTPGTIDTHFNEKQFLKNWAEAAAKTRHGYHAVLLVFSSIMRVTKEEKDAIRIIERILGDSFFEHVIFVFTYGDVFAANKPTGQSLDEAFDEYLNNLDWVMERFISESGRRCVLIDTTERNKRVRRDQNLELLGMVEDLVRKNKGQEYLDIKDLMEEQMKKHKGTDWESDYGGFRLNTGIRLVDNIANYIFRGLWWLFAKIFLPRGYLE